MLNYYDMTIPLQSLFIFSMFLALCIGCCLIPVVFRRDRLLPKLLILAGVVFSSILTVIYAAEARSRLLDQTLPRISGWMCEQPLWIPLGVILGLLAYELYLIIRELQYRKRTISRSSIKQGLDRLSTGLCFYQPGGRVVLVNHRMNELCFQIIGRDLQNAELFWSLLSSGQMRFEAERLSFGNQPSFRLPDGTVWSFSHEDLGEYQQLTAADTTQIQTVTDELKEKNKQLAALNSRLRQYGENVDALTRERERVDTKARIHTQFGQVLMATRRWLEEPTEETDQLLRQWKHTISMLRMETEPQAHDDPLRGFMQAAMQAGVSVEVQGNVQMPKETEQLVLEAATETLINAVRHAGADVLWIELKEEGSELIVCFSNNGTQPTAIIEGGGLGTLRNKVERKGGTMSIVTEPAYALHLRLPKRGENE